MPTTQQLLVVGAVLIAFFGRGLLLRFNLWPKPQVFDAESVIRHKYWCVLLGGFAPALISGLAQWIDSTVLPGPLAWIVIIAACVKGATDNVSNWMSTQFGAYLATKTNGQSGHTTTIINPKP